MKLYANVSSDRATKGQGGNKYIEIFLTIQHPNGEREEMGTIEMHNLEDKKRFTLSYASAQDDGNTDILDEVEYKTKGEKQKGEKCEHRFNYKDCLICTPQI